MCVHTTTERRKERRKKKKKKSDMWKKETFDNKTGDMIRKSRRSMHAHDIHQVTTLLMISRISSGLPLQRIKKSQQCVKPQTYTPPKSSHVTKALSFIAAKEYGERTRKMSSRNFEAEESFVEGKLFFLSLFQRKFSHSKLSNQTHITLQETYLDETRETLRNYCVSLWN